MLRSNASADSPHQCFSEFWAVCKYHCGSRLHVCIWIERICFIHSEKQKHRSDWLLQPAFFYTSRRNTTFASICCCFVFCFVIAIERYSCVLMAHSINRVPHLRIVWLLVFEFKIKTMNHYIMTDGTNVHHTILNGINEQHDNVCRAREIWREKKNELQTDNMLIPYANMGAVSCRCAVSSKNLHMCSFECF